MSISEIRTVTVFVSDQDKAKAFYTNTLGFDVRSDLAMGDNRWLEVAPPPDLDGDCAALTSAGVDVDGPQDMP